MTFNSDRVITRERRKAGSVHLCACGKRIEKCERYTRTIFLDDDGEFRSDKVSDQHIHRYEEEEEQLTREAEANW